MRIVLQCQCTNLYFAPKRHPLLLSCRFGLGRWDEMSKDERLKLGDKLTVAALEKKQSKEMETDPDFRHLPKGRANITHIADNNC